MNKYSKPIVAIITIGLPSLLIYTSIFASSYLSLQGGYAGDHSVHRWKSKDKGDHTVHPWVSKDKTGSPIGRVAAGLDWGLTDNLKLSIEGGTQGTKKKARALRLARFGAERITLDLLGGIDFSVLKNFDVQVKAGIAWIHLKNKIEFDKGGNAISNHSSNDDNYVAPKIGLGIGYKVNRLIDLSVLANHEFLKNKAQRADTSILAGLKVKFS